MKNGGLVRVRANILSPGVSNDIINTWLSTMNASLAKTKLWSDTWLSNISEYENQTLEAFVAASRLCAKFDCPVATAHDSETGL